MNIADTGKIVIINENNFPPVIISKLVTDSKSIENFTELQFAKITTSTNKTLNVYECTDVTYNPHYLLKIYYIK